MAARPDPLAQHSFLSGRRRHLKPSGLEPQASAGPISPPESLAARGALSALLQVQPVSLSILIIVLGVALWLGYGFVMGKVSPEVMVTVQQFEVPPDVATRLSLSAKSASDIAQDVINDVLAGANQFSGTQYYKYDGVATHLLATAKSVKTPVETSYGIELKGISLDNIMHLYNSGRYQQWTISGDILSSPYGLVGRVRSSLRDKAGFWQTLPSKENNPTALIQEATYRMLASIDPETFGRACLQRGDYPQAETVFRQWEMDDPRNWKPTYYLGLTYSYQQGKETEANIFANWSKEVKAEGDARATSKISPMTQSDEKIASSLQHTVKLALQTKLDPGVLPEASSSENKTRLAVMQRAVEELDHQIEIEPQIPDFKFEKARTSAKMALVQSYVDPALPVSRASIDQAVATFDAAAAGLPDNGGFHQQRAVFLSYKVEIMQRHKDPLSEIVAVLEEEVRQYKIALRMGPSETPPIWGAIYAQLALGKPDDAVELARTMTLLRPESQDAHVAFILAAEHAVKSSEVAQEEEESLRQVIASDVEENKLDVLWYTFRDMRNRKGLELIAAQGRQRFPMNAKFRSSFRAATEPKLNAHHVEPERSKAENLVTVASNEY